MYRGKDCVWASPLAGNLHLRSSTLLLYNSILPLLPPISPSFPSGALAIPIYLFLLPTKGKALPEYALCCWGLSGMLDSALFFSDSLSSCLCLLSLYLSPFPAPPLPPLALVAARGINRLLAELNVPIAESQVALAEGRRERGIDTTETRSDEALL